MARGCGCGGGSCGCSVEGSEAIKVGGVGTSFDSYVLAFPDNGPRLPRFTTATRPTAAAAAVGAMIFNTTTNIPNFSDGANWRNAAGTIV